MKVQDPFASIENLAERIYQAHQRGETIDGYTRNLLLRECYEQTYGLFDHSADNPASEYGLFAYKPKEDFLTDGNMVNLIKRYYFNDVKGFGLSLDEFLDLPSFESEIILKLLAEKKAQEVAIMNNVPKDPLVS